MAMTELVFTAWLKIPPARFISHFHPPRNWEKSSTKSTYVMPQLLCTPTTQSDPPKLIWSRLVDRAVACRQQLLLHLTELAVDRRAQQIHGSAVSTD